MLSSCVSRLPLRAHVPRKIKAYLRKCACQPRVATPCCKMRVKKGTPAAIDCVRSIRSSENVKAKTYSIFLRAFGHVMISGTLSHFLPFLPLTGLELHLNSSWSRSSSPRRIDCVSRFFWYTARPSSSVSFLASESSPSRPRMMVAA